MVKGASIYNPWRNPKLALERRNLVLRLLQQQKIIDQELYDMLSARPLGVQPRGGVISPQPAFMQMVRQELQAKLGDKIKDLSGVKIFTTFDSVAQDAAEKAVVEGIPALKKQRKLSDLETAMVVVDRFSGEVRAMVGGAEPQYAGYNRAMQARRSIGSLAKPATYLTALSQPNLYRLNTWIADAPISLRQPNGQVWSPQNDDRRYSESGKVMLVDALTRSMNVPTVNLGDGVRFTGGNRYLDEARRAERSAQSGSGYAVRGAEPDADRSGAGVPDYRQRRKSRAVISAAFSYCGRW